MSLPKNWVNTSFITSNIRSGDRRLHAIPSTVRLYFFLKSRFTNSSNKKRYCPNFIKIGSARAFSTLILHKRSSLYLFNYRNLLLNAQRSQDMCENLPSNCSDCPRRSDNFMQMLTLHSQTFLRLLLFFQYHPSNGFGRAILIVLTLWNPELLISRQKILDIPSCLDDQIPLLFH